MEFRVLGPLEVREGDRSLPLGGAKQRALLALLVLNAHRVVSRERLIDELWGDDPPETAVASVQVYVSRLRKLLGPEVLVTRPRVSCWRSSPTRLTCCGSSASSSRPGTLKPVTLRSCCARRSSSGGDRHLQSSRPSPSRESRGGRLEDLRLAAVEQRLDADLARGRNAEI
jgi:hypothetical protein